MFRLILLARYVVNLSRFVMLPVAMSLLVAATSAQAAIMIKPFEIPERAFFLPGANSGGTLSLSPPANSGLVWPSHQPGTYATGTDTTAGLQTAYLHSGHQILSGSLIAHTPYLPQVHVRGQKDNALRGHHLQHLAGSTGLADSGSLTANVGFLPSTVMDTAPNPDPNLGQALQTPLVSSGQQVGFNNIRLAAVPLDVVAAPEPATAIIWVLGLAGTACVGGRRRNAITTVRS